MVFSGWKPSESGYVYRQIADSLAERIESGEIVRMLPGEMELREQYGVALNTVRRAIQELRDRGLVETLPSKGTYVRGR